MSETMQKTEIDVKSIRAHDKGVIGCLKHKKDIMISYNSNDSEKDGSEIIDLFLSQEQAEGLLEELKLRIEVNKREE
jgi:hypothetical protein